jgi:hypothetical protein
MSKKVTIWPTSVTRRDLVSGEEARIADANKRRAAARWQGDDASTVPSKVGTFPAEAKQASYEKTLSDLLRKIQVQLRQIDSKTPLTGMMRRLAGWIAGEFGGGSSNGGGEP